MRKKQLKQALLSAEVWANGWRTTTPNCPVLRSLRWLATTTALSLALVCLNAIAAVAIEPDKAAFRGQLLRCAIADLDKAEALRKPSPVVNYVYGRTAQALGDFSRAVAKYDSAIALQPDHNKAEHCRTTARIGANCIRKVEPRALLAEWYARRDRHLTSDADKYRLAELELLVLHPDIFDESNASWNFVSAAKQLLARGRPDLSLVLFNAALRNSALDVMAIVGKGEVLSVKKRYREAIELFDRAISYLLPAADQISTFLVRHAHIVQPDEEVTNFGVRLKFSDAELLFEFLANAYEGRAFAAMALGHWEDALDDFNQLLSLLPDHIVARKYRARLQHQLRSGNRPSSTDSKAANVLGGFAELHKVLYWISGSYANPRNEFDFSNFVENYMERGLFRVAASLVRDRMANSERPQAWRDELAKAYSAMGDSHRALRSYDALLVSQPQNISARTARAAIYLRERQYDLAIADISVVLDHDPNPTRMWYGDHVYIRAQAYARSGRFVHAIADLAAYTALREGENSFVNFLLARSYAMIADYRSAVRHATKAVKLAPKYASGYELRALVYFILAAVEAQSQFVQKQWNGCTPRPE